MRNGEKFVRARSVFCPALPTLSGLTVRNRIFLSKQEYSVYLTYTFRILISININLIEINLFFNIIIQNILNIWWRVINYIKDRNLLIWLNYINIRICEPAKTNLANRYLSYMFFVDYWERNRYLMILFLKFHVILKIFFKSYIIQSQTGM